MMRANVAVLSPMLSTEATERSHPSCGNTRSGTTARRMARETKTPTSDDRLAAADRALRQFEAETAPAIPAVTIASICTRVVIRDSGCLTNPDSQTSDSRLVSFVGRQPNIAQRKSSAQRDAKRFRSRHYIDGIPPGFEIHAAY